MTRAGQQFAVHPSGVNARSALCLLILALAAFDSRTVEGQAQERSVSFQVKGSFAKHEGKITESNDEWFRLLTADGLTIRFYWTEVVDADADRIGISLGLVKAPTAEHTREKVTPSEPGLKVTRLADKSVYYGKELAPFSTPENIVIKSGGERYSFRRDQVQLEPKIVSAKDIYSEKELYDLLLNGQVPRTAKEHMRIAELCSRYGLLGKAEEHYRLYELLARTYLPEGRLADHLNRVRESYADAKLKEELYLMGMELMDEEYLKAMDRLNRVERDFGEAKLLDELKEVRRQIELARQVNVNTRIVESWTATARSLLRTKATDGGARFSECMSYAMNDVMAQTAQRVALRVGMEPDSVRKVWNERQGGDSGTADYGRGTWLVEMPQVGNVEAWWSAASNTDRFNILLGICAEQNLRVRLKTHKNCPTCGGTGRVKPGAVPPRFPSKDQCPDCMGLGKSRVVVFW